MKLPALIGGLAYTLLSATSPSAVRDIPRHLVERIDSAAYYNVPLPPEVISRAWLYITPVIVDHDCEGARAKTKGSTTLATPFSQDSSLHLPNTIIDGNAEFYFATDSSTLTTSDVADLEALAKDLRILKDQGCLDRIVIEARADQTFHATYNYGLSRKRGQAVAAILKSYLPGLPIETISFGSASPVCAGADERSLARNRQVRIVPNLTAIECGAQAMDYDQVFIDASGSMGLLDRERGYTPWSVLRAYTYSCGSQAAIFSARETQKTNPQDPSRRILIIDYLPQDQHIRQHTPIGRTPLKESLLFTALTADPGSRILYITDGDSDVSAITYQDIATVANARDISYSFICLSAEEDDLAALLDLAIATKGRISSR